VRIEIENNGTEDTCVAVDTNYISEKNCWEILQLLADNDNKNRRLGYRISGEDCDIRMKIGNTSITLGFAKNAVWDLMKHQERHSEKTLTQEQKDRIRSIIDE